MVERPYQSSNPANSKLYVLGGSKSNDAWRIVPSGWNPKAGARVVEFDDEGGGYWSIHFQGQRPGDSVPGHDYAREQEDWKIHMGVVSLDLRERSGY